MNSMAEGFASAQSLGINGTEGNDPKGDVSICEDRYSTVQTTSPAWIGPGFWMGGNGGQHTYCGDSRL